MPRAVEALQAAVAGQIWSSDLSSRILDHLCREIGPHPAGTVAMNRAVNFVLPLMNQAVGGGAITEELRVPSWTRGQTRIEVGASSCWSGHDQVVQYKHSQSTDVSAPLVEAGCGSAEELEMAQPDAAGSILLIRDASPPGRRLAVGETIVTALEGGALGLIATSTLPDGLARGALGRSLGGRTLPAVGVSTGLGSLLRGIAADRGRVRLTTEAEHGESVCHNVVTEIGQGNEVLVLSAHLDTHDLAPGGFDNTSGVCAMMEALFALAPWAEDFKRRIRFIAFTGEEIGFVGSRAYVQRHAAELDRIVFQLNLDSVFADTSRAMAAHFCRPAVPYLGRMFRAARRATRVVDLLSNSSDYVPLALQGIPTARQANLNVGDPPGPHTILDTVDKADAEEIKMNAMVYAQLILQLALTDEPFPARRLGRDEILGELSRWGALDQWRRCEYLDMLREHSGSEGQSTPRE